MAQLEQALAGRPYRVCAGAGWLLVLGDDLPWADGVTYLAWQDGLLAPTTHRVEPSGDLVLAGLRAVLPADHDLVVLLDEDVLACPMPLRPAM